DYYCLTWHNNAWVF
nr:immunoglobulin light chain junction region [Macaca mulatta]MOY07021.1 immunoglobulin light chain junction region [Macaca mulatta]MOY07762.1 immunoglobulin light chain junction region [Macaca mulatta]